MLNIDFSQVKMPDNKFELIKEGEYRVFLSEASVKDTKDGTGNYINCKFRIANGEEEGRFLFHMFNIRNKNQKAVEIGLSQLKAFMQCTGLDPNQRLTDVNNLCGTSCMAIVKIKKDETYGDKNIISYFKPLSDAAKTSEPIKAASPF